MRKIKYYFLSFETVKDRIIIRKQYFQYLQGKFIFSFHELSLPDDDPVYTLKKSYGGFRFFRTVSQLFGQGKNRVQPGHDICSYYLYKYARNTLY